MTLKFFLGRVKVDGTAPLRIRLKDGKRDTKITCPGIFINPKDWDKNFNMVNPKSPGADALNHEIKKYQVKTEDVKQNGKAVSKVILSVCSLMISTFVTNSGIFWR